MEYVCARCSHPNSGSANYCSSCGFDLRASLDEVTAETEIDFGTIEPASEVDSINLVVIRGSIAGTRYVFSQPVIEIGRHPDSDIFLDDVTVSRRHSQIVREAQKVMINDVGSLNGTYLNRSRINRSARLRSGDEVQIGKYKLVALFDS